jgi:hypothetical protein
LLAQEKIVCGQNTLGPQAEPDEPQAVQPKIESGQQQVEQGIEDWHQQQDRNPAAPIEGMNLDVRNYCGLHLYSIRSERMLMEQLDYNLLFRWFVGLNLDDPIWDATVFSKNRERLLAGDVARAFFEEVGQLAREQGLLSDEHFTVDGTLIEAWAGQKSFKPKAGRLPPPTDSDGGNPSLNFRGQRRTNDTHVSTTDPESRLCKKAQARKPSWAFWVTC